jgi:hypothetical protein
MSMPSGSYSGSIIGPRSPGPKPQSRSLDEIVSIMRMRRSQDSLLIQQMIEVRDRYNGDTVVPLPDVAGYEAMNRPGPNFVQEAVDGVARRANSMLPRIACPPLDPSDAETHRAERRQGALYARWYSSELDLKLFRAYRHLAGYGTCAMMVMPDDVRGHATIENRDPITAYPELRAPDDIRPPKNCGFLFARSVDWIRSHYPEAEQFVVNAAGRNWDTLWDMVEWVDENEIVIGIMGPRMPAYSYQDSRPYGYTAYELRRWKNKAGICPVVIPRRVTIDRIIGQLSAIIGYTDLYARLLSLALVADEKATFPDLVIISKNGMPPQLVNGRWKDGRSGEVNLVTDAAIEVIGKTPGTSTLPMLEMTEQSIRTTSGASALFGGAPGPAGRSGAAMTSLGGYSIDPLVQESQMIMQRALAYLNEGIMAVEEGYYPDSKFTVVLGLRGSMKTVTYNPKNDFRNKANIVSYPFPGADINQLSVAIAQKISTQELSKRSGRNMDPFIDDPDQEEEWVNAEALESALRDGFATQIAQGQMPVPVAARAMVLVYQGKTLPEAILQATAEAASQGPAPGATGADAGPPTAGGQPGAQGTPGPAGPGGAGGQMSPALAQMLAATGSGPQAGPGAAQPTAPPDLMNLRHVLQGVNENSSSAAV